MGAHLGSKEKICGLKKKSELYVKVQYYLYLLYENMSKYFWSALRIFKGGIELAQRNLL